MSRPSRSPVADVRLKERHRTELHEQLARAAALCELLQEQEQLPRRLLVRYDIGPCATAAPRISGRARQPAARRARWRRRSSVAFASGPTGGGGGTVEPLEKGAQQPAVVREASDAPDAGAELGLHGLQSARAHLGQVVRELRDMRVGRRRHPSGLEAVCFGYDTIRNGLFGGKCADLW